VILSGPTPCLPVTFRPLAPLLSSGLLDNRTSKARRIGVGKLLPSLTDEGRGDRWAPSKLH